MRRYNDRRDDYVLNEVRRERKRRKQRERRKRRRQRTLKKLTFLISKKKNFKNFKNLFPPKGRHRLQRRLHRRHGLPDDVRGHLGRVQGARGRAAADQEDLLLIGGRGGRKKGKRAGFRVWVFFQTLSFVLRLSFFSSKGADAALLALSAVGERERDSGKMRERETL
jgi:hypothetical protein